MASIYMLEVGNEEDSYFMPFSTEEKAINFIENNFKNDNPRKLFDDLYEGKTNKYVINSYALDQVTF